MFLSSLKQIHRAYITSNQSTLCNIFTEYPLLYQTPPQCGHHNRLSFEGNAGRKASLNKNDDAARKNTTMEENCPNRHIQYSMLPCRCMPLWANFAGM